MIPKIEFRYSWIYDDLFRESKETKSLFRKAGRKYPSTKVILKYIDEIKSLWVKKEKKILDSISKNSGLKWRENKIIVYVIGGGVPGFSDPLTMRIFKDKNHFVDTLIHELIHQIQVQDAKNWMKWWNYLEKEYKKESQTTKSHIFLDAVNYKVILDVFDKKRLQKVIRSNDKFKSYKIAWEIVQREGYENIIKEFKERIR
jgi:hypothetical protein